MAGSRYAATIYRKPDGKIHIYVSRADKLPKIDGTIIEMLYGNDEDELKTRAIKYVREEIR